MRRRLVGLKAKVDFEREVKERAQLETSWKATLPYAPIELFVLIGPRRAANLDWRQQAGPVTAHLDEL